MEKIWVCWTALQDSGASLVRAKFSSPLQALRDMESKKFVPR
ncbi:hypothetical protein [Streptomyces sp. B6B3]